MNRIIKFRAWDPGRRVMRDWEYLSVNPMGILNAGDTPGAYIHMQYTGLKDKNGKEINHSDLLRNEETGQIFEVIYSHGAFGIKDIKNEVFTYCFHAVDLRKTLLEVIGNIYENPELLQKEADGIH